MGPFSVGFLAGDPRAEPFLPASFRTAEGRRAAVERARARRAHPDLIPTLSGSREGIAALGVAGTAAVVTGQQVALFLGPLYSVYKAATAIVAARALERETGTRCVPVFWLQTEDHDFDEVDHCHALGPDAAVTKLRVTEAPTARSSVRTAVLGPSVTAALDQLEACVGPGEAMALMRACYRPGVPLAAAFAEAMAAIFPELVLVDPRHPALAHAAVPVHTKAITEEAALTARLEERARALTAAGFDVQVPVRPGVPLSFFHADGPDGPRQRVSPDVMPAQAPGRFSTSALLRPILQDTLLPTAAIVGGPGELNYFAQLQPLYAAYGLPMPMAVPRARFRVVDARTRQLLSKLGLSAAEVEAPAEQVRARLRPPVAFPPEQVEQRLTAAVEAVLREVPAKDEGLVDAVKRTRETIARAASRFAGRYRRSIDGADAVVGDRLRRAQAALFPNGEPQERVFCFAQVATAGIRAFVDPLLAAIDPWTPGVKELTP